LSFIQKLPAGSLPAFSGPSASAVESHHNGLAVHNNRNPAAAAGIAHHGLKLPLFRRHIDIFDLAGPLAGRRLSFFLIGFPSRPGKRSGGFAENEHPVFHSPSGKI
jgi:hypothetical protein